MKTQFTQRSWLRPMETVRGESFMATLKQHLLSAKNISHCFERFIDLAYIITDKELLVNLHVLLYKNEDVLYSEICLAETSLFVQYVYLHCKGNCIFLCQ